MRTIQACEDTEVAGLVDIRPGVAEEAAQDVGIEGVYTGTDLLPALESVRPDFVVDVTVPAAHHDVVITSLEAGLPVLGEKPMTTTMESAREMVAAADRTGQFYMVSQSRHYDANLIALHELIQQDTGRLGILNADFYIGWHMDEFRHDLEHLLLLDMGVHLFDMARYLSGRDAVSVYCEDFRPTWSWHRGLCSASAIFDMGDDLRFTFRGSWSAEGFRTPWQSQWRAVGPCGTALWDGENAPEVEVVVGREGRLSEVERRVGKPPEMPEYFAGSLRDFVRALQRGGPTPWGECHDNLKTLAMACAAVESASTGRRVPVPSCEAP